ncbi:hypothetical protein GCM10010914_08030 [Deinococcus wulumuqiensis]|uniref:Uncharacterized protein n=1 Tax=Deinococcus wulumuqiensis TaxID=980427 RepID=A0AAV4K3M7_9DEIO|nr:hypothetical protein GCM10010914_08030 [Deinococcus wulumuqiensis]GGP28819.1 hypothetical protein GCM10008021_04700 [Deinococcus wulumuqiensis]
MLRHGLHNQFLRVIPVSNDSSQFELLDSPEIKQHVIQLVGGLCQTARGIRSGSGLTNINRERLSVLDINQGTAGLLDPTFGSCSTAIPERAEVGSLLTGFAVKRGVNGQHAEWADQPTLDGRADRRSV